MKIKSTVKFIDLKVREIFYQLEKGNKSERELFKTINRIMDHLEENAFAGIQIPKKLISPEYYNKYRVKNLWKYDLPKEWRLIYSIADEEAVIVSLILEWFDHKNYERRFRY
ncbi:MAG: hypothetical protein U9Q06_00135 [Nanoarchaeota archaeon]|nr:hypothetical protein [Nanoarchaeota archaeon]